MKLAHLREALHLKHVDRAGWHRIGLAHPESVAAHSWGVAYLGLALCPPELDLQRVLTYAVALPGADDGSGAVLVVAPDDLDGFVSATAATLRIDGDGRFGHSLAALPGGGLLVGAPEFGQGGAAFALLPDDIWMPSGEAVHASDISEGIWLGMEPDGGFGTRVTGAADLDGDQWPDIAVGAPGPTDASTGSVTVTALPAGWPTGSTTHLN